MATITLRPLTNKAYGFPTRGAVRRVKPSVLAVIHCTGNKDNQSDTAALAERNYANRPNSPGPSAHYYVNHDGSAIKAIDPIKFAAWSNGIPRSPNTNNAGVKRLMALRAAGKNINEGCALEIENVANPATGVLMTIAQMKTCAQLIAAESKRLGIPVNRTTVLGHFDIDSVERSNCPTKPADHNRVIDGIINAANAILTPELPKTFSAVWTSTKPVKLTTTVTWTPTGFKIVKS